MKKNQNRKAMFPLFLVTAGVLLILGAVGLYIYLGSRNTGPSVASDLSEDNYPQVKRVSLENAKAAYELGSAVFVDVRTAEEYAQSHIPGALSIPLAELPERISELDHQDWIITY